MILNSYIIRVVAAIFLQRNTGEKKFDTEFFNICVDSSDSSCVKPDEIDFISGTYKNLSASQSTALMKESK